MKKIFCILTLLFVVWMSGACADAPTPHPPESETPSAPTYLDPTHKTGTYCVVYRLETMEIVHYYEVGEIPDPPVFEDYKYDGFYLRHVGWMSELVPVEGDAVYIARTERHRQTYTATFVTPYGQTQVEANAFTKPKAPEVQPYMGAEFVCWYPPLTTSTENITHTAVFATVFDGDTLTMALREGTMHYSSAYSDNEVGPFGLSATLLVLAMEEHETPIGGVVRDRILRHVESFIAPEAAPTFDASCNWPYALHTAAIALIRNTPTVWDALSYAQRVRLDTMMEAFAYLASFATSDDNSYGTGPGLEGNYDKNWNPNYRLANVPNILFAAAYFGVGDTERGSEIVNQKLKGFDEAEYDRMLSLFYDYGWDRAATTWSRPALTTRGGTVGHSSRELLLYGGLAVGKNVEGTALVTCGNGKGVTNGGNDYTYHGYTLREGDKILRDLIAYNYSGGPVTSEHWYKGKRVAWIVGDLVSPYQGQEGMMKEFNSGNRSSTVYCEHDFILVTAVMEAGYLLGIFDYTADEELYRYVTVGNGDFLFKNEKGYMSYSTGSYGTSSGVHGESGKVHYQFMKTLWLTVMSQRGK